MISYEIRTLAFDPRQPLGLFWDVSENPYFKFADRVLYGAFRGGECVGRVIGIWDERSQPARVYFAQLECLNDLNMARTLLDAVSLWGAKRGAKSLSGPLFGAGPFIFGDSASLPLVLQLAGVGYSVDERRVGFEYDLSRSSVLDSIQAQAERLRFAGNVTLTPLHSEFLLQILNESSCGDRRGWLKLNELEEIRWALKALRGQLDERVLLGIEVLGKPVGFALAVREAPRSLVWQVGVGGVVPRYRYWGLGCLLISELERSLVALGAQRVKIVGLSERDPGLKRFRAMRPLSETTWLQVKRDF